MLVIQNLIQEYRWGSLVGHPYITSLWLGSPICDVLAPKRVLRRSLHGFVLFVATLQALNFGFQKG
jgi:hypothetical protein